MCTFALRATVDSDRDATDHVGIRYMAKREASHPHQWWVYDGGTLRRTFVRAAALLVVCVFASLPTLARAHERLAARHAVSSFRLSKNVERPQQKPAPASLDPLAVPLVVRDDSVRRPVVSALSTGSTPGLASALDTRAPPVR